MFYLHNFDRRKNVYIQGLTIDVHCISTPTFIAVLHDFGHAYVDVYTYFFPVVF